MYSCGFRALSFVYVFRRFSPLTHTVTHTGFGRVVFGRLGWFVSLAPVSAVVSVGNRGLFLSEKKGLAISCHES